MSHFKAENAPKSISAGAPPQTPLGELAALPQTPQLDLRGPTSKGGEGRKRGKEGKGGREKRKGKEKERRGEKGRGGKGKGWGREWIPQGFSEMTPLPIL